MKTWDEVSKEMQKFGTPVSVLGYCKIAFDLANSCGLKWTKELPTKEGYYWFKFNNESEVELITVVKFNDKFYEDIGSLITLSEGEYCGPLDPPKHS